MHERLVQLFVRENPDSFELIPGLLHVHRLALRSAGTRSVNRVASLPHESGLSSGGGRCRSIAFQSESRELSTIQVGKIFFRKFIWTLGLMRGSWLRLFSLTELLILSVCVRRESEKRGGKRCLCASLS